MLMMLGAGLWAISAAPPVPTYLVKRAASPIVIDGRADEPAWAAAETVPLRSPWSSGSPKTTVKLLWDDNFLYAAADCGLPSASNSNEKAIRDDLVQILLNPNPSQTDAYIGLEISPKATFEGYLAVSDQYFFRQFHLQGVRVSTYIHGALDEPGDQESGWSLEAAIPWSNFSDLSKQFGAGAVWTANFARWDGDALNRHLSVWSDPLLPQPSPHAAVRFGELVFVK